MMTIWPSSPSTPDAIDPAGNLGVLLTSGDLLLLLLLLIGILGLAGVKLIPIGIELLFVVGLDLPGVQLVPIGIELLLVVGLDLPGVELVPIGVQLLIVVSIGTRNRRGRRGGVPSNPDSLARWVMSGVGHGYLQSTLGSLSILRALGLQSGQDAGDVVLAGLESLAQRSSDGQSGKRENDGATHIEFGDWLKEHSSMKSIESK